MEPNERLKTAAAKFVRTYQDFAAIPVFYRTSEWVAVKSIADKTRAVIETATRAVDVAGNWMSAAFGLTGVGAFELFPNLPKIAEGGIGAAVTAIMLAEAKMNGVIRTAEKRMARELVKQNVDESEKVE
jgi:hypothetical protein